MYKILLYLLTFLPITAQAVYISGIVKDERGIGIAGVLVSIEGIDKIPIRTDGTGDFKIFIESTLYTPGTPIIFQISKPSYEPESPNLLRQYIPNPNVPNSHIILVMKKNAVQDKIKIIGYVVDQKKVPVRQATVTLSETGETFTTQINGLFTMFISRKFLSTEVTLRTAYSDPKPVYVTLKSPPITLAINKEVGTDNSIKASGLFSIPKINNNQSSYLNFFVKEGDPSIWFENAKQFKLEVSDFRSNKRGYNDDHGGCSDCAKKAEFERYYSSLDNKELGIFGYGWHHSYESHIILNRSTLEKVIYRHYNGLTLNFHPTIEIDSILKLLKGLMPGITNKTTLEEIIQYEIDNSKNVLGTLNNILFIGNDLFVGKIKILPRGFQFNKDENSYFLYDKEGRLESIEEKGRRPSRVIYNVNGRIEGVTNKMDILQFVYNHEGLVTEISYSDTMKVSLFYDMGKRLIKSAIKDSTILSFKYDKTNRMVVVEDVIQEDTVKIMYDTVGNKILKENKNKKINWVYTTSFDTIKVNKTITVLKGETEIEDDEFPKQVFQYNFVKSSRELFIIDWKLDTTIYKIATCGCKTLQVKKRNQITHYEYNYLGYLTKVSTLSEIKKISYNLNNKIDTVEIYDLESKKVLLRKIFSYTLTGDLIKAKDNQGKEIELSYNDKGRIVELNFKDGKEKRETLNFEYNQKGKPILITAKGQGSIRVTYSPDGEIDKVDSGEGHKMALKVTSIFQELLDMVKVPEEKIDRGYTTILN
jgi:YD repeat-containing protein